MENCEVCVREIEIQRKKIQIDLKNKVSILKHCAGCFKVAYCGIEHQKKDWKQHKVNCFPIDFDSGCNLIATKNLPKGSLILQNSAILAFKICPMNSDLNEENNCCTICFKFFPKTSSNKCLICNWSLCDECLNNRQFFKNEKHTNKELCSFLSMNGNSLISEHTTIKQIDILTSHHFYLLMNQTSNNPKLKISNLFKQVMEKNYIVNLLKQNPFKINWGNENAHFLVFDIASFLPHSCLPNVFHLITFKKEEAIIHLYAVNDIQKGDYIYINSLSSYDNSRNFNFSLGTLHERKMLLEKIYGVSCHCAKCVFENETKTSAPVLNNVEEQMFLKTHIEKFHKAENIIEEIEDLEYEIQHSEIPISINFLMKLKLVICQLLFNIITDQENVKYVNTQYYYLFQNLYDYSESLHQYCKVQMKMLVDPHLLYNIFKWKKLASSLLWKKFSNEQKVLPFLVYLKEERYTTDESEKFTIDYAKYENYNKQIKADAKEASHNCSLCGIKCNFVISCKKNCQKVFYCSEVHSEADGPEHETICSPVIIENDEYEGRILRATRDIKENEVIFKETPLISSPSSMGKLFVKICLGCLREVKSDNKCSKCNWQVCSSDCENLPNHAKECKIFSKYNVKPFTKNYEYEFLKAMRCLINDDSGETLKKIKKLEAHCATRKKKPARVQLTYEIINFIRNTCQLKQFNAETIDYVVGVNAVNAFGILIPEKGKETRSGSYLFELSCMMSHNCEPNTTSKYGTDYSGEKQGKDLYIHVIASRDIKRGESITTAYVDVLLETIEREKLLMEGYFFYCSCQKCSSYLDEEEFNGLRNAWNASI